MPGEPHYKAAVHLLHHMHCHPAKAFCFYTDITKSAIYSFVQEAGLNLHDYTLFAMVDASQNNEDGMESTGCYLIFLQGGLIAHDTFVPPVVVKSSTESEINAMTVAAMNLAKYHQALCHILFGDPEYNYTVPLITDSQSGIQATKNAKETRMTKHILKRWYLIREQVLNSCIITHHVSGDDFNIADLGTKNCSSTLPTNSKKLSVIETPVNDTAIHSPPD